MEYKKVIDKNISELVYEKRKLIKAYNYYHGRRDPEQYKHLEENFGLGTASAVEFVPLVKKHIDVLVGEYLSTPVNPRISCKDQKTLSNILRDKHLKILSEVVGILKRRLHNYVYQDIIEETDKAVEKQINDIMKHIDENFISEYEIAAQNIVKWIMQNRGIDYTNKRSLLLLDLLISGTTYYRVVKTPKKTGFKLEVLNPLNTFIERSHDSTYLRESRRSVIRTFLTKDQILNKYGSELSEEDLKTLDNTESSFSHAETAIFLRSYNEVESPEGILGGLEVMPSIPSENSYNKYYRYYPVYEVEWIKTDKENGEYVENRYRGDRIGNNIYIYFGKDEDVIRPMEDPTKCFSSVNGIFYSDRNGDPFSLIIATMPLQDKFDVLNFYKDNIIAESGTKGDWLDVAFMPTFLGSDLTERLLKWKAYKKQGLALLDSSQEGERPMNTTFGGYDDTVSLQAINALEVAIQSVEETCSTITGVFREKLGGIEQKDAVTNVQVGVRQSAYITKKFYHIMDLLTRETLIDMLDTIKVVFKKGFTGTLVLGENLNKIFTALPEHYSTTDYDIHVTDSSEIIKEQEIIEQLAFEFAKNGDIDPEVVIEILTSSGLTGMKQAVYASMAKKKEENNQLGQLSQHVEELSKELENTQKEAQKLSKELERLNEAKLQLEKEKLEHLKTIEWFKAKSDDKYKESKIEWEKKRVQLEGLQLIDNNPRNNEVKDK